jgi:hypothetical protein
MLTSPLSSPQSPGGFGVLKFASVALIGILRTQLFRTPLVERLVPTPTLLCEDLNGLADCVLFLSH